MQKFLKRTFFLVIPVTIIIILISLVEFPVFHGETVWQFFPESVIGSGFVLFCLFCLKSILVFIPLAFLYVAAAAIFTPVWAIVFSIIFLTVEMSLAFLIGRHLGRKKLLELTGKNEKIMKLIEYLDKHSIISSFVIRFIPGPPADVSSMFLGATNMEYVPFIAGTILGMVPNMIPVILMGEAIKKPTSKEFLIPLLVSILFATVALIIQRLNKIHGKKRKTKN